MRTWLSGRALASQAEDREFESRRPLQLIVLRTLRFSLKENGSPFLFSLRLFTKDLNLTDLGSVVANSKLY